MKSVLTLFFLAALLLGAGCTSVPHEPHAAAGAPDPVVDPPQWEARVQRYLARDQESPPEIGAIVFCGSSSIDMWRPLETSFPGLSVVNRGIGGTLLTDLPEIAPRLVYPLKPRTVVVYAGENDLTVGRTVAQVVEAFRAVRDQIHAALPQAPIIFLSIKPSPRRVVLLDQMREANRQIAALCSQDPQCTFVDVFTPMLNADGQPREELFIEDQLHMNTDGYRLWTQLVAPLLARQS